MYKIVIASTNSKAIALQIKKDLLLESMSPCVQMLDNIESSYLWKGKVEKEKEILLLIKCKKENLRLIEKKIKEKHNYEVPEIISIDFEILNKEYKDWFDEASEK